MNHPPRGFAVSEDLSNSPGDQAASDRLGNGQTAIDVTVPHSARIWNYWLGGKDNYEVDRVAGDQFRQVFPAIVDIARSSRLFLTRSAGWAASP